MSSRRRFRLVAGLFAIALVVAACSDDKDKTTTGAASGSASSTGSGGGGPKGDFSIAFVGPLTGSDANLGIYIRDGAKTAIDAFNKANPDTKITLKEFDTQGDPAQAPTVLDRYINDDS